MFYFVRALAGDTLKIAFRASKDYGVRIVERPDVSLTPPELVQLKQDCQTVVRACLAGESLDYGLFAEGSDAWSHSVITLVTRTADNRPVAFNAMPQLDVIRSGEREVVLHLGLVMVDPEERSGGFSWILYGLTCFARFLRQHLDHITIQKLRRNEQLTPQDLSELERILVEQVGVTPDELQVAVADGGGLGLFVRSLVGLERDAAKAAFAGFIAGKNLTGNQITFINLIIDHLTHKGAMDPRRLYESPFTDLDDQGVSGVFPMQADVARIVQVLHQVRGRAAA